MISVKIAESFTKEQRESVCEWCKAQGKTECKKCGITQTPPRAEKVKDERGRRL